MEITKEITDVKRKKKIVHRCGRLKGLLKFFLDTPHRKALEESILDVSENIEQIEIKEPEVEIIEKPKEETEEEKEAREDKEEDLKDGG